MTYRYLFFPFTHITDNDLESLLTFFPQVNCLSIERDAKKEKAIKNKDIKNNTKLNQCIKNKEIIPFSCSSATLDSVQNKFEQYLEWTKIQKGNEHNLKLLLQDNPYFTNDSSVTTIKSQIKRTAKDQQNRLSDESKLKKDLLFLKMAQLYDEQHEGIDLEFKDINKISEELVANLRGTKKNENQMKNSNQADFIDSGTIMTRERISAWFNCIGAINILEPQGINDLFITTNEEVFNYFESNCKDVIMTLDIDNIKVHETRCENREIWQGQFEKFLMGASKEEKKKATQDNPENKLPEVLDRCSKRGQIKVCNFFMSDINHNLSMAGKHISVCLIKLK